MNKKMWKVVSPIEKKDGTVAYWARLGNAHSNKDDSINVYLDTLPTNGKIQLREFTEQELRERSERRATYTNRSPSASLATLPVQAQEPIPF
jgi:hypothetical protein